MSDAATGGTPRDPERYDIRVTGHLARRWAAFFDGMTLTPQDDGTTVIHGPVADQSALHGLLRQVSDLGLPLVSVTTTAYRAQADRTAIPTDRPTDPLDPHPRRSTT